MNASVRQGSRVCQPKTRYSACLVRKLQTKEVGVVFFLNAITCQPLNLFPQYCPDR